MSSRNPTVSNSTMFSKKIKKSMPPISIVAEAAAPIEEAPDFLRSLNIIRAPPKPAEPSLPCKKTETEEIIAAMKKTLMASPAPTPVILPKKRKRPIYDFKHLAEKIAKHDHNAVLNPKVEDEVVDNVSEIVVPPVPVVVKNKGKNLMNQVEVGLIKQNRLRKKRVIPPMIPKKAPKIQQKKAKVEAKIEIKEETVIKVESIPAEKIKNQVQAKKKAKVPKKKTIDENFASRVQTRNRKKNFIEESLSNVKPSLEKEVKPININNESSSSFVDVESSQEVSLSDVPPKNSKTVKVNPFKPKARNRRKPGVFFGSRKRKRNLKTENKKRQPPSKVDEKSKLKSSNSNSLVPEQIDVKVSQNCMKEPVKDIVKTEVIVPTEPQKPPKFAQNEPTKTEITVPKEQQKLPKSIQNEPTKTEVIIPKEPQESPKSSLKEPTKSEVVLNELQESPISAQNESSTVIVTEENKVAAPTTTADTTTESKEPEEAAEPHWQTQSDGFFDLPSEVSLGSILSSVNQAS